MIVGDVADYALTACTRYLVRDPVTHEVTHGELYHPFESLPSWHRKRKKPPKRNSSGGFFVQQQTPAYNLSIGNIKSHFFPKRYFQTLS